MDRSSYSGQLLQRLFCWKRLGTKRSHVDAVSVHPRIWGGYRLGGCSLKRIEQAGNKILVERTRFLWWNTDLVIYSNKLLIPRFDSFSAQLNLSIFQMTQINYCRASNFTSSRLCFFRRKERVRDRPLLTETFSAYWVRIRFADTFCSETRTASNFVLLFSFIPNSFRPRTLLFLLFLNLIAIQFQIWPSIVPILIHYLTNLSIASCNY